MYVEETLAWKEPKEETCFIKLSGKGKLWKN